MLDADEKNTDSPQLVDFESSVAFLPALLGMRHSVSTSHTSVAASRPLMECFTSGKSKEGQRIGHNPFQVSCVPHNRHQVT